MIPNALVANYRSQTSLMEDISVTCSCHQNGGKKIHNYFVLETMLPVEYNYLICTYNESANHTITSRFHLNCLTKTEALEWIDKCSSITKVTFNIEKEDNKIYAKCSSCTGNKNRCQTALEISINPHESGKPASSIDQNFMYEYPTTVIFHYTHDVNEISNILIEEVDLDDFYNTNDSIIDASANTAVETKTRCSTLDQFVHQKLYYLFEKKYSPQTAYDLYKKELHEIFAKTNNNKTSRPCLKWVCEQYYAYLEKKHSMKLDEKSVSVKPHANKSKSKEPAHAPHNPLNSKINELCKKYVPILPACNPRTTSPEPEISVSSVTPHKLFNSFKTSPDKTTPSYIIRFNPKLETEKLNLFPLKLISNDVIVQNKLPELKIVQNSKNNHTLKVSGFGDRNSQNISIPSGVDGVVILTNDNQKIIPKSNCTNTSSLKLPSNEKSPSPPPPPPTLSRKRKHPRKSRLKCEDADEIVFTNNIEDLQIPAVSTTTTTTTTTSTTKTKTKKPKRRSTRVKNNNKKKLVVQCPSIDGIENVICSD